MDPIRVLLVDDHALFREGLALILNAQPDFEVVGEARDGQEALENVCELRPDLVLMDLHMPRMGGIQATRHLKRALPQVTIVILAGHQEAEEVIEALLAGAQGCLLKRLHSTEMLDLLRNAVQADPGTSSALALHTLNAYHHQRRVASGVQEKLAKLTAREQEILRHAVLGTSDKEIARALRLSLNTVKTHMRHILTKLNVTSRRELGRVLRSTREDDEKN